MIIAAAEDAAPEAREISAPEDADPEDAATCVMDASMDASMDGAESPITHSVV